MIPHPGYPISSYWRGVPNSVEAGIEWSDSYIYLFKGLKYVDILVVHVQSYLCKYLYSVICGDTFRGLRKLHRIIIFELNDVNSLTIIYKKSLKVEIKSRKSKDRQYNGQNKKDKRTNNDVQSTTQKT